MFKHLSVVSVAPVNETTPDTDTTDTTPGGTVDPVDPAPAPSTIDGGDSDPSDNTTPLPENDNAAVDDTSGGAATTQDDDTDTSTDIDGSGDDNSDDSSDDDDDLEDDDEIVEIIADTDDVAVNTDALTSAAETLTALTESLEKFGPSKAVLDVAAKLGAFDTSVQTLIAKESFGDEEGSYENVITLAQEGMKEKAGELVSRVGAGLSKLSAKIVTLGSSFKDKMKQYASSGKEWISKHPVAASFAGVAAIAAVAGVIAFATGRLGSASLTKESVPELYAKIKSMIGDIKFPWVKVTPKPDPNVLLLTYEPYVDPFAGNLSGADSIASSVQARTWTGPKLMDLAAKLDTALNKLRAALGSFGKVVTQIGKDLVHPSTMMTEVTTNVASTLKSATARRVPVSMGDVAKATWRYVVTFSVYMMTTRLVIHGVFKGLNWMEARDQKKLAEFAEA